ncbi:hypothetical protein BT67DRAFT_283395 [Trichocladium antarcticum]|uniref:Uncharacterized protein n=1 Tax=Trichocladium antarcticum TaxID=1450529 RepID=A0AAN6ULA5_9PEZI|nr:hypothetical protein BT67DRAFT_283395 [Trichocladium antarcticum]
MACAQSSRRARPLRVQCLGICGESTERGVDSLTRPGRLQASRPCQPTTPQAGATGNRSRQPTSSSCPLGGGDISAIANWVPAHLPLPPCLPQSRLAGDLSRQSSSLSCSATDMWQGSRITACLSFWPPPSDPLARDSTSPARWCNWMPLKGTATRQHRTETSPSRQGGMVSCRCNKSVREPNGRNPLDKGGVGRGRPRAS